MIVARTQGKALMVVYRRPDRNGRAEYSMSARAVTRRHAIGNHDVSDMLYGHRFSIGEIPALAGRMVVGETRRISVTYDAVIDVIHNPNHTHEYSWVEFTSEKLRSTHKPRFKKGPPCSSVKTASKSAN